MAPQLMSSRALHRRARSAYVLSLAGLLAACAGGVSNIVDGGEPPGNAVVGDGGASASDGALGDGGSARGDGGEQNNQGEAPDLDQPRTSARVFLSGHSLIDNPLPDHLEAIAESLGGTLAWNQQNVIGSPIRIRTRGNGSSGWSGYSQGKNRTGSGMNVIEELRNPRTLNGARYDTLLITERHDMLGSLFYEETVRLLRHFHERLIEGNPQASTFLYTSWLGIPNKSQPQRWQDYERGALPVWQCVVERINVSLAHEGRADRVHPLPASGALLSLVDQALAGDVEGLSGGSTQEVMNRLFRDDVHLTPVGVYYMALVSYAALYRSSPVGAFVPSGVSASQAAVLQRIAWAYVADFYARHTPPTLAECSALMRERGCANYWNFRGTPNNIAGCVSAFGKQSRENPFWFNESDDASYWFPAP